ncbi:uncharacterized protein LOC124377357 [Tachysurus ichikawai]
MKKTRLRVEDETLERDLCGRDSTSGESSVLTQDRAEPENTAQEEGEVGEIAPASEGEESASAAAALTNTVQPVEKPAEVLSTETDTVLTEREHLIYGARLDIADSALQTSGLITLGHLVDLAGPELKDTSGVAARLGLRSIRIVARLLQRWNSAVSREEQQILVEYCGGPEQPDEEDPFPELSLSPD